jgi:hypothetical protein
MKRICHHPRRTERQQAALRRKLERAQRTTAQQLFVLGERPGQSAREIHRLGA